MPKTKKKKNRSLSNIGSKELVGIDLGSNNLKIIHVKASAHKKEVVNILNQNIAGLSDTDTAEALRAGFGRLGTKNPDIITTLSPHLVITKNIEIPSVDPDEIKEIINLQASRHTPYSREEIIADYLDIGIYKHSYTKILLVIVARNVVKRQAEILAKAGLHCEKILFSPEGIALVASKILKTDTGHCPISIIHIDENFTDFTVIFKNKPVFIRSIPIGTYHLTTDEKDRYQVRFAEELGRSLETYQSENIGENPEKFVLTGAIEDLKDMGATLNQTLNMPIESIPYLRNLTISEEALNTTLVNKNLSFLSIIASLVARDETKIDLVPEEVKLRKAIEQRGFDLIKTGVMVLTVFVLIFSVLTTKIYFKITQLKDLDARYQSLNPDSQKLEKNFTKISTLKKFLSGRGYSLEILTELYDLTTLDVEINEIKFNKHDKFSIKGTAVSMSTVFTFVDSLEKSKYFDSVKTNYTTKRKAGARDVTDFEITSLLNIK